LVKDCQLESLAVSRAGRLFKRRRTYAGTK